MPETETRKQNTSYMVDTQEFDNFFSSSIPKNKVLLKLPEFS